MESVSDISPTKIVKGKQDKKKKKKTNSNKAVRQGGKPGKEGKIEGRPSGKKLTKYPERQDYLIPTKKPTPPPKGSLASFLDYFVNRRRLLGELRMSRCPSIETSRRCSKHIPGGGGPGDVPGHHGEAMSLCWPGNASGFHQRSWRKCLGRGHFC
ncbi:hypothetical protein ILYODFUR_032835 [Ilyodon furcidens]|uniref:Uncharacterized protein n=1 Tax=Ilyodon furcidens TaxID=33524 RepID=A0ABV0TNR8_9TELE